MSRSEPRFDGFCSLFCHRSTKFRKAMHPKMQVISRSFWLALVKYFATKSADYIFYLQKMGQILKCAGALTSAKSLK